MALDFYSNLKKTNTFQALQIKNHPLFRFAKPAKHLFLFLFALFLGLSFYHLKFISFALLSISIFYIAFELDLFLESDIKAPKPRGRILEERLELNLMEALFNALEYARERKKPLNSSLLLYFLLSAKDFKKNFLLSRLLLTDISLIKDALLNDGAQEDVEPFFREALSVIEKRGKECIEIVDLIALLSFKNEIFKRFLIEKKIKMEDVEEVVRWVDSIEKDYKGEKKFWEWKNLIKKGVLAREWSSGYTPLLDRFSFDVTHSMRKQGFRRIFAHEKEVKEMEKILAGVEKNDVLIVGEEGTGRRSMVEALARNIAMGESLDELNYQRVVYLDLPKILSFAKDIDETEALLDKTLHESQNAGNVILVIDNIHQYIGVEAKRETGAVEITGILASYLPSPSFRLIGICTYEGLHKNIEKREEILSFFEKIEVSDVTEQETIKILEDRALRLERKYKIFFSFPAIREIVEKSAKYLPSDPFPEKAIEILDEAATLGHQRKIYVIRESEIDEIVTRKSNIPVGEIEDVERKKLLELEQLLHNRIVDQEEAVKEISSALRRARAQIGVRKGPMGSFLFLGPTGVGKTETAKALAEIYFGSENRMIRLDMSEFQSIKDIPRLLGGSGLEGLLTTPVRENPFSLILLDEFEKAHPNILNLFLQVFDEGHMTDGMGRKVFFKNTIIIATSNAGYQLIFKAVRENQDWNVMKEKLITFLVENGIFRPELLNRFDGVILFKPLTPEDLLKIAQLILNKVKRALKEQEIELIITEKLKEKIVELSYDPQFGARNMERVIQDKVGNVLAQSLLKKEIKSGDRISIDPENFIVIKE